MEQWQEWLNEGLSTLTSQAVNYLPKIALAIIILVAGNYLINRFVRGIRKLIHDRGMDRSLMGFLGSVVNVGLKAALFIAVLGIIEVETSSLIAVLGAAGLAVGLALQGSLANFAGGVMILIYRPFRAGDYIEAQGHKGYVESLNIFVTKLKTLDNKTVVMPNGPLSNGNITNYTTEGKLRVEVPVGISYGANIKAARDVLMKVLLEHPKVLEEPAPVVRVLELGDSSVNLSLRPFCLPKDYWEVQFDVVEQAKIALDEAGIEIPFPQRVIHQAPTPL